jgi:predicted membrane metal-binding protein
MLASAVVAVACGWGSVRLARLDQSVLAPRIGTAEIATVEVENPPRVDRFDQRMNALVLRWGTLSPHESVLLELPLGRSPPQGARLRLVGKLRAPPGPSNGFDEAKWLRRQGIHAVLQGQSWGIVGRRGGVAGVGDRVGRWLTSDTTTGLSDERRDVIEAIVVGRSSEVDQTLLGDFRATGLYHCLAVDGLKVAAVGGGAAAVVLCLGLGIYVAQFAALLTVAAYALAVGLHPSVVRAALAAGLGSLAWLAGRERDRWQALLVVRQCSSVGTRTRSSTPGSSSRSLPSRRSSSSPRASSECSRDTRCRAGSPS